MRGYLGSEDFWTAVGALPAVPVAVDIASRTKIGPDNMVQRAMAATQRKSRMGRDSVRKLRQCAGSSRLGGLLTDNSAHRHPSIEQIQRQLPLFTIWFGPLHQSTDRRRLKKNPRQG